MSCFGKLFFRGMKGGELKKRYIFGVPLFWGRLWILHGMWFKLFIERTSFESGNYLLIFIGRMGHKFGGFFDIA